MQLRAVKAEADPRDLVSSPRNSASVFQVLPPPIQKVIEYMSIFITSPDRTTLQHARPQLVRRQAMYDIFLWPRLHNPPPFADVTLPEKNIAALPENGVPAEFAQAAMAEEPTDGTETPDEEPPESHVILVNTQPDSLHPVSFWEDSTQTAEPCDEGL